MIIQTCSTYLRAMSSNVILNCFLINVVGLLKFVVVYDIIGALLTFRLHSFLNQKWALTTFIQSRRNQKLNMFGAVNNIISK